MTKKELAKELLDSFGLDFFDEYGRINDRVLDAVIEAVLQYALSPDDKDKH